MAYVFLRIFQKIEQKFSIGNISTTTHTKAMNYNAFERSDTGLSFVLVKWDPIGSFFRCMRACCNKNIIFDFGANGLVVYQWIDWQSVSHATMTFK